MIWQEIALNGHQRRTLPTLVCFVGGGYTHAGSIRPASNRRNGYPYRGYDSNSSRLTLIMQYYVLVEKNRNRTMHFEKKARNKFQRKKFISCFLFIVRHNTLNDFYMLYFKISFFIVLHRYKAQLVLQRQVLLQLYQLIYYYCFYIQILHNLLFLKMQIC